MPCNSWPCCPAQALGAEVVLETTAPLQRLFRQSFPDVQIIERPDHPDQIRCDRPLDYAIPLMSLPHRLQLQPQDRPPGDRLFARGPGRSGPLGRSICLRSIHQTPDRMHSSVSCL